MTVKVCEQYRTSKHITKVRLVFGKIASTRTEDNEDRVKLTDWGSLESTTLLVVSLVVVAS